MYLTQPLKTCKQKSTQKENLVRYPLDAGSVLLPVLGICSVLVVVATGLITVASVRTQIESNRANVAVAFYAAMGFAISSLHQIETGDVIRNSSDTVGIATIHTVVQSTQPWKIFITATVPDATDTISFSYDKISKRLLSWQDNGPAP
jgi:hypothetical protein